MRWIVDLDHTLVDTDRFKADLAASFAACGVAQEQFWATLRASYAKPPHVGMHGIAKHLTLLGLAAAGVKPADVLRELAARTRARGAGLLYPDVLPVLQRLIARGDTVHVVTLGDPDEQRLKFEASGLAGFCASYVSTTAADPATGKALLVAAIVGDGRDAVNVNDSPREVSAVAARCPKLRHFLIRRPGRPEVLDGPWVVAPGLDLVFTTVDR